jgi:hypothetical protein
VVLEKTGSASKKIWEKAGLPNFDRGRPVKRWELAVLLDKYADVFHLKKVDLTGEYVR